MVVDIDTVTRIMIYNKQTCTFAVIAATEYEAIRQAHYRYEKENQPDIFFLQ